jgi:GntR family transcriptional regulator, transcriptional repressor for pyruvate dehydrogenase complex
VRRILEPAATALAAPRLTEEELDALADCLTRMDAAGTTQSFIDADVEFHGIIVNACGNTTLGSLIQNLSGGTLRARVWRAIHERGAVESAKRLHHDIYRALRARDADLAAAADLIHLADGERWLRGILDQEAPSRTARRSPS